MIVKRSGSESEYIELRKTGKNEFKILVADDDHTFLASIKLKRREVKQLIKGLTEIIKDNES